MGRCMRSLAALSILSVLAGPAAAGDDQIERIVTRHIRSIVPADGAGGVAVALRLESRTLFFNYGLAERTGRRPITSDSLFNLASLRKVFDATLLAQAARNGELRLDDKVADYVPELRGADIRRVTLGQLATHTSGLLLPQDHLPWPDWGYTLPQFIRTLNAWRTDSLPGREHLYTHAGYILLQLALERRFGVPIDELLDERMLRPLGMRSTTLPRRDDSPRGRLSLEHQPRAVQGYGDDSAPIAEPGDQQGYYRWPATSQMYSSPRDMAVLLAANLGRVAARAVAARGDELGAARGARRWAAQRPGTGLGSHFGRRGDRREIRRPQQRLGLYRHDPPPQARHRDPRQSRQSISQRGGPAHAAGACRPMSTSRPARRLVEKLPWTARVEGGTGGQIPSGFLAPRYFHDRSYTERFHDRSYTERKVWLGHRPPRLPPPGPQESHRSRMIPSVAYPTPGPLRYIRVVTGPPADRGGH
jgi:beta-lactamase class C